MTQRSTDSRRRQVTSKEARKRVDQRHRQATRGGGKGQGTESAVKADDSYGGWKEGGRQGEAGGATPEKRTRKSGRKLGEHKGQQCDARHRER